MSSIAPQDIIRLRNAINEGKGVVDFSAELPTNVAKKVLTLLDEERKDGAIVIPVHTEFRTSQAATILGVSRPHLSRMINSGEIEARQVGVHWRVPARAIDKFLHDEELAQQERSKRFNDLQIELGITE